MTAFTAYSADMNRAPAPVTSIEEMSLNRLWAAPKLPRLSFNQLAVSGCTVAVPSSGQRGRWRASRQLRGPLGTKTVLDARSVRVRATPETTCPAPPAAPTRLPRVPAQPPTEPPRRHGAPARPYWQPTRQTVPPRRPLVDPTRPRGGTIPPPGRPTQLPGSPGQPPTVEPSPLV